jgi:cytosine/adenosine deaminase-related metal-dependent hydrolase
LAPWLSFGYFTREPVVWSPLRGLQELGIGRCPGKVLQVATLGAAKVAKADRELGSIQPGKRADLALISGDPVRNISDIRRCTLVIRNGAEYRSAELYAALGIRP